jgi:alkanesulfonate monooxygenase SsuD/methylene tetrahydromethanopterin reductase-like flavin-dependent oxidoreductase (luciferase family)
VSAGGRRAIVGSPATVEAGLRALADEYGAEEIIIVTIVHEHAARRRSYELVAQALGLRAAAEAAAHV